MCAICTQLRSAGTPLSAHLPGTLHASRSPLGGLPRRGGCLAERHGFSFLLTTCGWDPDSVAVVGLILQALEFYLTCASEDGYLQPCASKQGGEEDTTCMGAGYQWLSEAPASRDSPSST